MNPTSVDAALALVRGIFVRILAVQPSPPPAPDARDHRRRAAQPHAAPGLRPDPDRTADLGRGGASPRTRRPHPHQGNLDLLTELTSRRKADGHLPQDADSDAAARIVFALMHGLLVCHHLPDLTRGLTALGAGLEPR
jgi:hypothetical protein